MKIHWSIKAAAIIAVLAAGAFGGYKYYVDAKEQQQAAATAAETVAVQRMDLKSVVSATGTIRPVDSVEVSSKITARIKTVLVKENDTVTAGQTVATLDGKNYEAKRDQSRFQVTNTLAKYNRIKYLYSIGAKSQEELEDAEYAYNTAQSNLEVAESDLNETVITAPMSGVVVGEPKTAGTMAVQGSDNPTVIMRIADLSDKLIMAKIDETDIGNVRVGQEATFTVDSFTDKTFTARVLKISQTDTSNSWNTNSSSSSSSSSSTTASVIYYYVTLDVDDPENLLLPAMTARVDITTAVRADALAIPISALKTDAKGSYVLLVHPDGTQENRYIKTGIYSDDYVEVTEGLTEGDEISNSYTAKTSSNSDKNTNSMGGRPPHF